MKTILEEDIQDTLTAWTRNRAACTSAEKMALTVLDNYKEVPETPEGLVLLKLALAVLET